MFHSDPAKDQLEERAKHYWQVCPGAWGGKHKKVHEIPSKPQKPTSEPATTGVTQSKPTWKIFSLSTEDKENIKQTFLFIMLHRYYLK